MSSGLRAVCTRARPVPTLRCSSAPTQPRSRPTSPPGPVSGLPAHVCQAPPSPSIWPPGLHAGPAVAWGAPERKQLSHSTLVASPAAVHAPPCSGPQLTSDPHLVMTRSHRWMLCVQIPASLLQLATPGPSSPCPLWPMGSFSAAQQGLDGFPDTR